MSLSLFAAVTRAPRWRWWRLGLRLVGWGVLAAWSLALLVWLTFHWGILPRLDEWRPRIEAYASHALGLPVQIGRILPLARQLFPVGEAVGGEPWLGRRPCLPDSLPLIGPAPRHEGLYIDTGHSHLGFTLGPVTGRLIAEMIAGGPTVADPTPFSAARFPRV